MNDKPKCPVFGCTIPRGVAHEHPAGVSAVMRDPAAPLNADERAELEQLRAHVRQAELLTAARTTGVYVVPDDAVIHSGRKLRDALILAGSSESSLPNWPSIRKSHMQSDELRPPRRTLAQSVGKFMSWMFSIPALLLVCFAIGNHYGWWV